MTDERLANVETKVDHLEIRFDRLETKVDHLEVRFDHVETRVDHLEVRFDHLETRVDHVETKVDYLISDVRELKTGLAESRTETRVLFEASQASIQAVADGLISLEEKMQRGFTELHTQMVEIVAPIAATIQHHTRVLDDHEQRLRAVEGP